MPLLLRVDPHDLVAEVLVLAEDVGEGVVDVVVRVLPGLGGRGGVPVPGRGVDLGIVHPVPLAVQDVVADLHVLEDLRHRERRRAGDLGGAVAGAEQQHAADHREAPLHRDHALDVAAIALAEVGVDPVADRIELAAELLELLRREVASGLSASGVVAVIVSLSWFQSAISIGPSGALTQVRIISPSLPWTSPVRRSRTSPRAEPADAGVADAHPAAEGQHGAGLLAADQDRRAAVTLGLDPALGEAHRAALRLRRARRRSPAGSAPCGAAGDRPPRSQCALIASSISAGPERKAWRSRQSGQSRSRSPGPILPCSPVIRRCSR